MAEKYPGDTDVSSTKGESSNVTSNKDLRPGHINERTKIQSRSGKTPKNIAPVASYSGSNQPHMVYDRNKNNKHSMRNYATENSAGPHAENSPRSGQHRNRGKHGHQGQGHGHQGQGQGQRYGQNQRNDQGYGKMLFEPYWPMDKLSDGLKRGELIQGVIRVNPKNFEDSYVPLPDGTADIYIPSLRRRNRAFNGDVVAVQLLDRDDWRVYTTDLENYEKSEAGAVSLVAVDDSDSDDSGPDVIIEQEEVIGSVGLPAAPPGGQNTRTQTTPDTHSLSRTGISNDNGTLREDLRHDEDSLQADAPVNKTISDDMSKMSITTPSDAILPAPTSDSKLPVTTPDKTLPASAREKELPNGDNNTLPTTTSNDTALFDSRNMLPAMTHSSYSTHGQTSVPVVGDGVSNQVKSGDIQGNSQPLGAAGTSVPAVSNSVSNQVKSGDIQSNSQPLGAAGTNTAPKPSTPKTDRKGSYTSVKDVLQDSSPIVKKLLSGEGAGSQHNARRSQAEDKFVQKTGKVVAIIEKKHPRACGGYIKPMRDKNPNVALFSPTDSRLPRIQIPVVECPKDFLTRPNDHANTLFIARISDWKENSGYATGHLARSLGEAGQIEPETEALLIENDVDYNEFSDKVLACLPSEMPWVIPQSEYKIRRDFRRNCVFTIDPSTARDLDDAVSCEHIGNGVYEVGVHIADVSYFIQEDTPLDNIAASRANSVYLVQKVIPMLPRLLCEKLCSLNPDEDRLTFSVVWKMNLKGEVFEEWFGRTIIRSCVKLSYEHAQGFIEEPDKEWTPDDLPPVSKGFSVDDIKSRVLTLQEMAQCLRKARFDGGALRLDQVKIQYTLDKDTGLPNGYFVYQQKDSNKLIEEFMLMANMAVAHKIYKFCPGKSLLRRHPPPQEKALENLGQLAQELGVPLDCSDSGALHASLLNYCGDDEYSVARMQVLVAMCSKPMQIAQYFCAGLIDDEEVYRHYALNVPLYTHFTSPIRRYPDIMVHRMLAASLGYHGIPNASQREIQKEAENCNERKTAAKRVSDLSLELFFAVFVKEAGPFEEKAMVMGVLDKSFDVFILKYGVQKRVYCDKLNVKSFEFHKIHKQPVLTLVWPADDDHRKEESQQIAIFTIVTAQLATDVGPLKWKALICRP